MTLHTQGGFAGPQKLYKVVKSEGKYQIGMHKIRQFLHDQESYSLHKPVRRRFQRNHVISAGKDDLWMADLIDMVKYADWNQGYKYILLVIDTFSKYVWLQPLKYKTGGEVANAFKTIFDASKRSPTKLITDKVDPASFRLRRHSGLCPTEMSRETCFYSQLNMLMKIHDNMMDPVSLRNIGKRNGNQNVKGELLAIDTKPKDLLASYRDVLYDENPRHESTQDLIMPSFEDYDVDGKRRSAATKDSRLLKFIKLISKLDQGDRYHIMKLLEGFDEQPSDNFELGDERLEQTVDTKRAFTPRLPLQAKRHIICPASMSRIECYDQALAFYMRLMRSVGKQ